MNITAGRPPGYVTLSFDTPVRLTSVYYWLGLHPGGPQPVARYAATATSDALRFNPEADMFFDGA